MDMNQPWIYMYSPSRSPLPPPSLPNPSGSSQCTRPEHLSHASRDTCTPTFIATLFIIARTWKQPRCPSADEWIKKLWHIHTMEYYSAIKKNSFESVLMRWMKLEPIIPRFSYWLIPGHHSVICSNITSSKKRVTENWATDL